MTQGSHGESPTPRQANWIDVGSGIKCDTTSKNIQDHTEVGKKESYSLCIVPGTTLKTLEHKPVVTREVYDTTMGVGMPAAAVGGGGIGVVAPLIFRGIKGMFVK